MTAAFDSQSDGSPLVARPCEVLVIGDEVESILTAVSAARAGASVALARRSRSRLGGLSVRGGLTYMDITPDCIQGLFAEFLERTALIRVALNPDAAHRELLAMLREATIPVYSGVEAIVDLDESGCPASVLLNALPLAGNPLSLMLNAEDTAYLNAPLPENGLCLNPTILIDSTPDADIMRALGLPYIIGLGGLLGDSQNFLGVSPVFRIANVSVEALQTYEAGLRAQPNVLSTLATALPFHTPEQRAELVTRPTYAPEDSDYLDILNPLIGIDYHCWRHGDPATYPDAGILIDGGNISRLKDGTLGFNGLVAQASALDLSLDDLLALSQDGHCPLALLAELDFVERYLRQHCGFTDATVLAPESLYVRQTVTLLAKENMTARDAIAGGVPPEAAVGTFSYWLDLRGTQLTRLYPDTHLPKPVFNVGLSVALPPEPVSLQEDVDDFITLPRLQNIAFVGRSAGFSPLGQGTGRIVQHNAMLGEGLGIAAALAISSNVPLARIVDTAMPQIQTILRHRLGGTLKLDGHAVWTPEEIASSAVLAKDVAIVETLRKSAGG